MDRLYWSIDSLVIKGNVVFGFGWLFHEEAEVENLELVIEFEDQTTASLIVDYGKTRNDVEEIYKNFKNTSLNSGFQIYGTFISVRNNGLTLYLRGHLSNGEIFCLKVPQSYKNDLNYQSSNNSRKLFLSYIMRGVYLIKNGEITQLVGKVRKLYRSRPKLNLDSAKAIHKLLEDDEVKNLVLLIDHDLGGGANLYRERLVEEMVAKGVTVFILSYHVGTLTNVLIVRNKRMNQRFSIRGVNFILELATLIQFKQVIYNNAVSFAQPEEIPQLLYTLKSQFKSYLKLLVHDYFMICPSYQLFNNNGIFCEVPNQIKCQECLSKNHYGFANLFMPKDISIWRGLWKKVIQTADEVVVFSNSSKELLERAYPDINISNVILRPHKMDYAQFKPINIKNVELLRVGIVGHISFHKGAQIVKNLAQEIKKRGEKIEIIVFGSVEAACESSVVKQTGTYKVNQLPDLISKYNANVMFFPSICPETFSFVTHELIKLELPVACFNMGAQAEKISKYSKGIIINDFNSSIILDTLINFFREIYLKK